MRLNPFRRQEKALTATPAVRSAITTGWSGLPRFDSGSRDRIRNVWVAAKSESYGWVYQNSPAVRTVVDAIVRNAGQLDLGLYELSGENELQPRPEHPAAQSVLYPWETMTGDQLVRALLKDYLLYDDAYAILAPGPAARVLIRWVPAGMVEARGESLFDADYYRIHATDGSWSDVPAENVLHWHGENPLDPRIGSSRLDTLRSVIAEDAALQQATVELANSGMSTPSWVFRPEEAPEWSSEAAEAFAEDLANRIRRRNRVPVVLEEGMELRDFGVSPRDAQMFEIRRWAIERVATEYGVPLGVVGLADDVSAARSVFVSDTLSPLCQEMCRFLDLRLLVRAYGWTAGRFAFDLDEKLMGDERLKALVSATGRAVLLTNEARKMIGRGPVDGGDELVTPLNVLVGENPLPSPGTMPVQDPNGPDQGGGAREGDAPAGQQPNPDSGSALAGPIAELAVELKRQNDFAAAALAAGGGAARALAAVAPARLDGKASRDSLPQLHPGRAAELARHKENVDAMRAVLTRYVDRFSRSVGGGTSNGNGSGGKADAPAVDWRRWDRELSRDLNAALTSIVSAEGSLYALKLGGHGFDEGMTRHYIRAMATGAASGINEAIAAVMEAEGVQAAVGRAEQAIQSAGANLGGRATTWARTEAARQVPGTDARVKTWVADTQRHAEFDGDTVALGDDWPAGFAPGTAPGCECTFVIS